MKQKIVAIATMIALYAVIWFFPYLIESDNEFLSFIEQPITILLPTIVITKMYLSRRKSSFREWYPLKKLDVKTILILTILAVAMIPLVNYVIELFSFLVTDYSEEEFLFVPGAEEGIGYALLTFAYGTVFLAIFPGICEEILFRGSLLKLMEDSKWKVPIIVLFNGLLFGIFHGNMEQLFYTTVMGIVLTEVVILTRSIYASIYIHIVYNFIVSLSDIIEVDKIQALQDIVTRVETTNSFQMALISTSVIIALMLVLAKKAKRHG